ncbi:hypothetical protein [Streptomyces sp. NPDC053367]|uniref:hypothetical protein n=1 Tax=Streptomyces sp. NPDC053367 TaxID=3365700 RepID=UPI0037D5E0CA
MKRTTRWQNTVAASAAVLMAGASVVLTAPQADAITMCYDEVDYVRNSSGVNGASGRASFCYNESTGFFDTTAGQNWVKDLVNGDGVAARLWVVYRYPDEGFYRQTLRATDTVSTSGATSWGWSGYFDYAGAYVCLGTTAPLTSRDRCNLLYDTTGFDGYD